MRVEDVHCCQTGWEVSDKYEKSINTVGRKEKEYTPSHDKHDRLVSYSDDSKKSINHKNWTDTSNGKEVKSVTGCSGISLEPSHSCNKSEKSLNCSNDCANPMFLPCEREESFPSQTKEITITTLASDSDSCKKLLIRYQHTSASLRAAQGVEIEEYILARNWTCESDGSKKSINQACCEKLEQLVQKDSTATPTNEQEQQKIEESQSQCQTK